MTVPILGKAIDERFLMHRLKSTSIGGMAAGVLAMGLFAYRYYFDHVWSWDLLAVGFTMAAVKWALMLWFHRTD
jgi:protein-S-isoprenylcysteine O-methyltransferase Ste14